MKLGKKIGCSVNKCWIVCTNLIMMMKAMKRSLRVRSKSTQMNNSMRTTYKINQKTVKSSIAVKYQIKIWNLLTNIFNLKTKRLTLLIHTPIFPKLLSLSRAHDNLKMINKEIHYISMKITIWLKNNYQANKMILKVIINYL